MVYGRVAKLFDMLVLFSMTSPVVAQPSNVLLLIAVLPLLQRNPLCTVSAVLFVQYNWYRLSRYIGFARATSTRAFVQKYEYDCTMYAYVALLVKSARAQCSLRADGPRSNARGTRSIYSA